MNRRQFLGLSTAATAAMMLDPERLLWVPGAKTFFLPDKTIVEAKTMEEALMRGFIAVVPNGHGGWSNIEVQIHAGMGLTLAERFQNEVASIKRMGGRVIENRVYTERDLQPSVKPYRDDIIQPGKPATLVSRSPLQYRLVDDDRLRARLNESLGRW